MRGDADPKGASPGARPQILPMESDVFAAHD